MTDSTALPPAGWFADSQAPGQDRFWDGEGWTDQVRPTPLAPPPPSPLPVIPGPTPSRPVTAGTGLATASLVLGIVAAVFAFIPGVSGLGIAVAIAAVVTGGIALLRRLPGRPRAAIGTILGAIAFILAIVMTVVYAIVLGAAVELSSGVADEAVVAAPSPIEPAESTPTPVASPTSTPSPTPTPTPEPAPAPAPAPAAPTVSTQSFNGTGDSVVDIALNGLPAVITFDCPACDSNTVLETNGSESLLVNEIGAWNGQYLVDVTRGSVTSVLTISASGDWAIAVEDISTVAFTTGPAAGHGDRVVHFTNPFSRAAITNTGESNFVVIGYGGSYPDLAVNEIGGYSGTVPLEGPGFVQVTSSGDWTITPG